MHGVSDLRFVCCMLRVLSVMCVLCVIWVRAACWVLCVERLVCCVSDGVFFVFCMFACCILIVCCGICALCVLSGSAHVACHVCMCDCCCVLLVQCICRMC